MVAKWETCFGSKNLCPGSKNVFDLRQNVFLFTSRKICFRNVFPARKHYARQQRVVVDGVVTSFFNINRGVPQRNVLGPLLFTIMVNDIKPVIPQTLLIKYADDITASVPVTIGLNHTDSSHQKVANIKRWADDNLMKLHKKKTFEMVVKDNTRMPLPESIDGIARKSELKLLGVTVNEDPCNWDTQFENMPSKASSRLYILGVCKYYG